MDAAAVTKDGRSGAGCSSKTAGGLATPTTGGENLACNKESSVSFPTHSAAGKPSALPSDDAASEVLVHKHLGKSPSTPKACLNLSLAGLAPARPVPFVQYDSFVFGAARFSARFAKFVLA